MNTESGPDTTERTSRPPAAIARRTSASHPKIRAPANTSAGTPLAAYQGREPDHDRKQEKRADPQSPRRARVVDHAARHRTEPEVGGAEGRGTLRQRSVDGIEIARVEQRKRAARPPRTQDISSDQEEGDRIHRRQADVQPDDCRQGRRIVPGQRFDQHVEPDAEVRAAAVQLFDVADAAALHQHGDPSDRHLGRGEDNEQEHEHRRAVDDRNDLAEPRLAPPLLPTRVVP